MKIELTFDTLEEQDQYIRRMCRERVSLETPGRPWPEKEEPSGKKPKKSTTKKPTTEKPVDDLLDTPSPDTNIVTSEMITGECSRIVAKLNQDGKKQIRTILEESGFPGLRSIPKESRADFYAELQKIGKSEEVTLD